ncbi:hypothetical protein V2P20_09115 [Methylobacter sp. Wu1]|uniref:hypothetical protein n=1 Tax=Methylobacter sp. Wu1 TaxID=3119359 RepID=UPI002F955178
MPYLNLTDAEKIQAPHVGSESAILTIAEDSCDGEFDAYIKWLENNFPELELNPLSNTSGGSSLIIDDESAGNGDLNWYWESFCNSHVSAVI